MASLVRGMDKFPQVPGSVIVQNFPSDWYYSDFVPVDGKINPISPQGEFEIQIRNSRNQNKLNFYYFKLGGIAVTTAGAYGRLLPVQLSSTAQQQVTLF